VDSDNVIRLYPAPQREMRLHGLYLEAGAFDHARPQPLVYTSYIASLDGRIAVEQSTTGSHTVPHAITNPHDARLYQELAARADVLLVSARFLRELALGSAQSGLPLSEQDEFSDLQAWRAEHGLAPQPAVVILSASLDLPLTALGSISRRRVFVATGGRADPAAAADIERHGATLLVVGDGKGVDGKLLIDRLAAEGFRSIYSIAGPVVLETLLHAGVLHRLYLTQVHRLLGGESYDTLLEGDLLQPPADFSLQALYYDNPGDSPAGQFFGIYEIGTSARRAAGGRH
jgi:riboflavin biosynthesis pyrimidine reductase